MCWRRAPAPNRYQIRPDQRHTTTLAAVRSHSRIGVVAAFPHTGSSSPGERSDLLLRQSTPVSPGVDFFFGAEDAWGSVVDALEVPRAINEVAVDKRKQAAAGELVVVATDRPAPPLLGDPLAVAYLDLLARACPAQTAGLAGGVEV